MTSESKILTVSYGTFSCTLEGFDDPFNTMKAIAEYFRDLAAEDRYFGAEPPQPDAAMLHRIAEREVSRLVEAKVGDTGVSLRPQAEPGHETPTARITGRPRMPHPGSATTQTPEVAAVAPTTIEPSLQDIIPSGVAAKLARIRQSVEPQPLPAHLSDEALDPFVIAEDDSEPEDLAIGTSDVAGSEMLSRLGALINAPADDADEDTALLETAKPDVPEDDVASTVDSWLVETDDALLLSDVPETVQAADLPEDEGYPAAADTQPEFGDADVFADLAETLEDEPATSQADAATPIEAPLPEDAPIEASLPEDALPEDTPEAIASLEAALRDDPLAEALADSTAPEADDLPVVTAEVTADFVPTGDMEELEVASAPVETQDDAVDAMAEAKADDAVDAMAEAEAEAVVEAAPEVLTLSDELAPTADPVSEAAAEAIVPEPAPEYDLEPKAEPVLDATPAPPKSGGKTKRVNSRVVRIHAEDDDAVDPSATRIVKPNGEDAEVARLLRQADDVMAEEGNRRRLDSIAHMKAAVAATEADRAATGEPAKPDSETRLDPYRDVLAQVVQPEPEPSAAEKPGIKPRRKSVSVRPQEPRPGTIRPGMISPPPLVLVSEQRIDRFDAPPPTPAPGPSALPDAAEVSPMVGLRTGRLTGAIGIGAAAASPAMPHQKIVLEQPSRAGAVDTDEDDDLEEDLTEAHEAGLASFADQVGVKSMADMLEAAAAYATCVEKRDNFTRPQLMRRLMASAGGKAISREEGLRSFGTLLRTGRIEKVSRGQYVLAEHSPYLSEARRLG